MREHGYKSSKYRKEVSRKCCILVFSKKHIPPHLSLTAIDGVSCSIIMKAGGTYDAFVKRVYDAIDWSHLFERIAQMENEAITAAIDKLSDSMI